MRVLISADMEGTCGVSSWVQVTTPELGRNVSQVEYDRARLRMTWEVNAAVEGAYEAGAESVIVTDAHGSKRNLLPDELDRRVRFVSGSENDLGMMQAINEPDIGAVFFTGYHARAGTPGGPLAHTSTGWIQDVRVDGISMGEYGMNALIAGHFGIPVALVTGDNLAVAQTRELLGNQVVGVTTKDGHSTTSATHVHPEEARNRIRAGAVEAMQNLSSMKVYALTENVTIEIDLDHQSRVDQVCRLPGTNRIGWRTFSVEPENAFEFGKFWRAILTAGGNPLS